MGTLYDVEEHCVSIDIKQEYEFYKIQGLQGNSDQKYSLAWRAMQLAQDVQKNFLDFDYKIPKCREDMTVILDVLARHAIYFNEYVNIKHTYYSLYLKENLNLRAVYLNIHSSLISKFMNTFNHEQIHGSGFKEHEFDKEFKHRLNMVPLLAPDSFWSAEEWDEKLVEHLTFFNEIACYLDMNTIGSYTGSDYASEYLFNYQNRYDRFFNPNSIEISIPL